MNANDTSVFVKCALDIEKSTEKSVKWFVTSDSEAELAKWTASYSSRVITTNISHSTNGVKNIARAILDLELLSMCDELLITGCSTFGFISALKSGKYPLLVMGKVKSVKCQRFTFRDPLMWFY